MSKQKSKKLRQILATVVSGIYISTLIPVSAAEVTENNVPEAVKNITSSVEWHYRAFGQSTDLRFHNSANISAQDGINNVWVNPEWINDTKLKDSTGVLGQTTENPVSDPDVQLGQPGSHQSIFTESSLFVPPLEGAVEPDESVTLTDGDRLVLESRGGKITNGHDGITFFYTELPTDKLYRLTADITKSSIGSHPAAGSNAISNQTGGGIMARDFVPEGNRAVPYIAGYEEPPSCSNFVGVGLWQNNDLSRPGYALRSGVVEAFHSVGSQTLRGAVGGTEESNPVSNSEVGLTFRYVLEHRNDGFYYTVTSPDGAVVVPEVKIESNGAVPDMLMNIDEETAYWGFAASREIRILVENIVLEEVGDATFEHVTASAEALYPNAEVVMRSGNLTRLESHDLGLRANYDGTLTVKENDGNGDVIYEGPVTAYDENWTTVELGQGENNFFYSFVTEDEQPAVKESTGTVTVTREAPNPRTALEAVWVSPTGGGNESGANKSNPAPVEILAEAGSIEPGQTVYLVDGEYGTIAIAGNSGNKGGAEDIYDGNRIVIQPEPGVEFIRALNVTLADGSIYVHIKNIIAGGTDADNRFEGDVFELGQTDYILTENCYAQWSEGSGFSQNSENGHKGTWAKYNTFLNCEATHNEDEALQNSDGFQMQGFGIGNRYIGCVASYSGDDGWDHFLRVGGGPGGSLYFENCIAHNVPANGFKLGGEGQPTPVKLVNCLSYDNGMAGFSDNFNPGEVELVDCIAVDNGTQNFIMRDNPNVEASQSVSHSVSFRTAAPVNFFIDAVAGSVEDSALIYDTWDNSVWDDTKLTAENFASMDRTLAYTRDEDGTMIRGDFAKFLLWEK